MINLVLLDRDDIQTPHCNSMYVFRVYIFDRVIDSIIELMIIFDIIYSGQVLCCMDLILVN
jgi:hypothetical protein